MDLLTVTATTEAAMVEIMENLHFTPKILCKHFQSLLGESGDPRPA